MDSPESRPRHRSAGTIPADPPARRRRLIATPRTLPERERELQTLLASAAGREELRALVARYAAESGKPLPPRTSAITYILVHERGQGLIG